MNFKESEELLCLQQVTNEIMKQYCSSDRGARPFIVAIDGLGGAGKTTFVKELVSMLENACTIHVLHIDDYIVESEKRYNTGYEEWYEYYYLQWDIAYIKYCFSKIHKDYQELTLPFYNRETNTIINMQSVFPPNSILLIEGVFLQRHEWEQFYDYTVFLECSLEIRKERVLKRDSYIGDELAILKKYKQRYWMAEQYYLEKESPLQKANIIWQSAKISDY